VTDRGGTYPRPPVLRPGVATRRARLRRPRRTGVGGGYPIRPGPPTGLVAGLRELRVGAPAAGEGRPFRGSCYPRVSGRKISMSRTRGRQTRESKPAWLARRAACTARSCSGRLACSKWAAASSSGSCLSPRCSTPPGPRPQQDRRIRTR
jgi:hypothetical protein